MKKAALFVLLTVILPLSLSSCRVNWFDRHYDVPWWMIAVPVAIFSISVWFAAVKYIASKKYVCPKCNQTFSPKWWKVGLSIHVNDDRLFRCPHCGKKGFCWPANDQEK